MAFGGKTLTVYLAADISKLKSGLNGADREMSGFAGKLNSLVGPALIGAAAAAGAFAVSLAVDGVQAAMQEEAELAKLSTTLQNLGFGAATEQVNTFIDDLQYTAAVSDSTLRPAFERLLTSTNSVTESQKLLKLALDVSAGTGKSLEAVTNALGKAYDGNLGALGKLGAGIDTATIKSKDLDGAVAQLGTTFAGQATAKAGTLQGQIDILKISFDELKESLGKGLIDGFTSVNGGIGTLSTRMRDLQPQTEDLGRKAGTLGGNLLEAAIGAKTLADRGNELLQGILSFGGPAFQRLGNAALDQLNPIAKVMDALAGLNKALNPGASGGIKAFGTGGAMAAAKALSITAETAVTATKKVASASGGGATATEKMSSALRNQIDLVKDLTKQLDDAGKALIKARKEMTDWQESMAANITSGIDLGAVYDALDEAGKKSGASLLAGFQKQIDQAGVFGGYLQTLNREGGPELRDAVAALGPEAGSKLAKLMIDEGLVKTFQDKLVTVKDTARTAADAMTPEFLVAGVNSAVNFLTGTQQTLAAASSTLAEMGREMGKTIGEAAAAEIAAALKAAGVAQTGAMNTLAGTPGVGMTSADAARIAAGAGSFASSLSSTSIAQAIARAISDSDARLGRTGGTILQ